MKNPPTNLSTAPAHGERQQPAAASARRTAIALGARGSPTHQLCQHHQNANTRRPEFGS
ncbi:MAG: hypothetical protein ACTIKH_12750 [Glutamicibacter ardleyensis]|uniref:hypothetical protein n=1 Tax=Glutamicibacter ardleyensis TaxID=225894 RepID=UPI003F9894DA